jgi:hypothetical protein
MLRNVSRECRSGRRKGGCLRIWMCRCTVIVIYRGSVRGRIFHPEGKFSSDRTRHLKRGIRPFGIFSNYDLQHRCLAHVLKIIWDALAFWVLTGLSMWSRMRDSILGCFSRYRNDITVVTHGSSTDIHHIPCLLWILSCKMSAKIWFGHIPWKTRAEPETPCYSLCQN